MRFWMLLSLLFWLGPLSGCSRPPTLRVTLSGVPSAAVSLAVSLALQREGGVAMAPLSELAPYELPQPGSPETDFVLRLPLPSDATLLIGVAAFDRSGGGGCLLALGHAAHIHRTAIQDDGVTIALAAQLEDPAGCQDAARIVAVTPSTLAAAGSETLQVRGWGFRPGARIVLSGVALETRYVSGGLLEATVPPSARFQTVPLEVELPDGTRLRSVQLRYVARKLAFAPSTELALGEGLIESQAADLDGDGRLDLVLHSDGYEDISEIKVALQRAPFTFDVKTLPAPSDLVNVLLRDMDRDGDLDIVMASTRDPSFDVFVNDSRGNFSRQSFALGTLVDFVSGVHVVDLNGDGAPEVLLDDDGKKLYTFPNDGQGGFSAATRQAMTLTAANYSSSVTSLDYDLDGRRDVLLVGFELLSVFKNPMLPLPSADTAAQQISFSSDIYETGVETDIDGDAIPDLLLSDYSSGLVLLPSVGQPVRRPVEIVPSCISFFVDAADIDGDGRVDLATACEGGGEVQILLQGEALRFALRDDSLRLSANIEYWSLRLADLDGDNKPDLIFSASSSLNASDRKFFIYRNVSQ